MSFVRGLLTIFLFFLILFLGYFFIFIFSPLLPTRLMAGAARCGGRVSGQMVLLLV